MRIHVMLAGGSFDGQMYTLLGPEAKKEIRVMRPDATATTDAVAVEVYALIPAEPSGIPGHLHASYRWVGARESSIHLVDLAVEE